MDGPWYDKLFWIFMAAIAAFIAWTFLRILIDTFRIERTPPGRGTGEASGGGSGFHESHSPPSDATHDSGDSHVETADGAGDSAGGGDFSGGGGDYGGGGSSGSWS
jgi:hypothetical protein